MKKALCTLLAVVMAMGTSSVALAKDSSELSKGQTDTTYVDTVQPRIREKDIRVFVRANKTEICSDYNLLEENVTVVVKSVDHLVGTLFLTLELSNGKLWDTSGTLQANNTYTFFNVPSGGYTIYAHSNQRSGYCTFSVADDIV